MNDLEIDRLRRATEHGDLDAAHALRRLAERTGDDALRAVAQATLIDHALIAFGAGDLEHAVDDAGLAITAAGFDRVGHRAWLEPTTGGLRVFDLHARRDLPPRAAAGQSQVLWGGARATSLAPDGAVLVTRGAWGNDITTIELDTMRAFDNGHAYGGSMVTTFSLDGRTLLVGSCDHNDDDDDPDAPRSALQAWQRRGARTGRFLWAHGVEGQVDALAFADEARLFVATQPTAQRRTRAGLEGRLALLELRVEQPGRARSSVRAIGALALGDWPSLRGGVRALHIEPDTAQAVLTGEDHVLVVDLARPGHARPRELLAATCAAFSPDGRFLVTGTSGGTLEVRAADSLEAIATLDVRDDDQSPGASVLVAVHWSTEHELWAALSSGRLLSWPLWVAMQP